MKKLISMILVLLLVLPVNLIGYAASDITPPKLINVSINSKELKVGDVLKITFELAPDLESGLNTTGHSSMIELKHSSGEKNNGVNFYIGNNKFQYERKIDSEFLQGEWNIESVTFRDNAGNYSNYHIEDDAILKALSFNVKDGAAIPVKPELRGLTILTPKVSVNEDAKINLDVYDPSNIIVQGTVAFVHKETGNRYTTLLTKKLNESTWEAILTVPDDLKNGEWYVEEVSLGTRYTSYRFFNKDYAFLQNKKITITGGLNDFTVPKFHSIEISKSSVQPGDTFEVTVEAEDKETEIKDISVAFGNKLSPHTLYTPDVWTKKDGKYTFTVQVPVEQLPGKYLLKQIYITDNANNTNWIMPKDLVNVPEINIQSIFTGTDGEFNSILTGSTFEPMYNVQAISNYEGDLTNDITYNGNVDTQTKGVYLVTYSVNSKNENYTYKDYRWVSVNDENTLDNSADVSTAYFKSNVDVVVPSSLNVSLKSESTSISVNGKAQVTSEGVYTATINSSQSSTQTRALSSSGSSQTSQFKFVIDRTLPTTKLNDINSASTSVTGLTEPNAKLTLNIKDIIYVGKADSTGKFTIKFPKQKVNTNYSIQAKDLAGNIGKQVSGKVVLPLTVNSISNRSTLISGSSVPYASAKLYINNKYVKQTKVNMSGEFKFAISSLSPGKIVKIVVNTKDASTSFSRKVSDKLAPVIQKIDKVSSNSTYVTGKVEKYAKIRVDWMEYQGIIAEGKALSNGSFKIKIRKLKKGSTLRIWAVDAAGNESYKIIKVS
ncbi:Ig-like domain-containing protein [Bacillus sp. EAC]|uniref:Ig-like domain-containing protein n=1 Tax=Bacillus sp. EAC TaxID=1978338 RepID=UPI000B42D87A|nr:Ig-like domain-containing protein [Bacillus sp. EAC]